MTNREFESFCKAHVLPRIAGWVSHRDWIARPTAELVLAGVSYSPSRFSKEAFDLRAIAAPLYSVRVPVAIPISRRLAPPKSSRAVDWRLKQQNKRSIERVAEDMATVIREEATPWLAQRDTPAKLLSVLMTEEEFRDDYKDTSALAPIAAPTAAAAGDIALALDVIDTFDTRWRGTDMESDRAIVRTRELLDEWRTVFVSGETATRKRLVDRARQALDELKLDEIVHLALPPKWDA